MSYFRSTNSSYSSIRTSASSVILVNGDSSQVTFGHLESVLEEPDTQLRLFGKPKVKTQRHMGVVLALDESIELARAKALRSSEAVQIEM